MAAAASALAGDPPVTASGAHLEDKRYAVTIHSHRLSNPGPLGGRDRPGDPGGRRPARAEVIPGRMVWKRRPAVRGDKGHAVRRLVAESGTSTVQVVGHDRGDLPALSAAAQLGEVKGEWPALG